MARKTPSRQAFPAVALVAALAALAAGPAGAAEVACRESRDYVVEVDGKYPPDARFYESDTNGTFLVDIPSLSKSLLIDLPAGRAVPVPRANLRRETIDGTLRVREPGGSDAPTSRLTTEGEVVSFQIDSVRVRLLRSPERPRRAGSTGAQEPAAAGAPADSCLGITSRPALGIPSCSKWVYIRNSCTARVVATVQRTEHLLTGNLPQAFSVVVPAASEQSLGCSWWSGAMAPTEYELLGARFVDPPRR